MKKQMQYAHRAMGFAPNKNAVPPLARPLNPASATLSAI
jgi:hypothetical protein